MGEGEPTSGSRLDVGSRRRERGVLEGPALVRGGGEEGGKEDADVTNATTTKSFPLPPILDAIKRELERIVKDSLSSFVLLENYPRRMMQIIVR
jgi:hypothetical protein